MGDGGRYDGFDREWVDEESSRVWIQGDLHAENFGTYMDADGRLVFDVNDFDEAYLGHWTWDLARFAASLSLLCWQKALPDETIDELVSSYVRAPPGVGASSTSHLPEQLRRRRGLATTRLSRRPAPPGWRRARAVRRCGGPASSRPRRRDACHP